jgi:hypothetical protein
MTLLAAAACFAAEIARAEEPPAPRPPHPEPRVIVSVLGVRGPHSRDEVEHSARLGWSRIVRCYKAADAQEKANITLELLVSADGRVKHAKRVRSRPKDRELGTCLGSALQGLPMPKARTRSIATVEIRLAPGDPPPRESEEPRD